MFTGITSTLKQWAVLASCHTCEQFSHQLLRRQMLLMVLVKTWNADIKEAQRASQSVQRLPASLVSTGELLVSNHSF